MTTLAHTKPRMRVAWEARSTFLQTYGILLALVVVGAILSSQSSEFLTKTNLLNVLDQMALTGIMAVGMTVLMISGAFDLSVGSTLGLAAAFTAGLAPHLTTPGAIGVALATGLVIGLVNGLVVTKAGINAMIVTLGMLSLIQGVTLIYTNGQEITTPSHALFRFANGTTLIPNIAWVMIAVALAAAFMLHRTTTGRYITAVGGNSEAAELAGLHVDRYRIGAFVAMGGLAALAGVLYAAQFGAVDPSVGNGMELNVIAAVIIGGTSLLGGIGAVWKSMVGVALLTMLTDGFNLLNVNAYWQYVVQGLVIICAVAVYTRRSRR